AMGGPIPSSPYKSSPQHHALASLAIAHTCWKPRVTAVHVAAPILVGTAKSGCLRSPYCVPQHHSEPSLWMPHVDTDAAATTDQLDASTWVGSPTLAIVDPIPSWP